MKKLIIVIAITVVVLGALVAFSLNRAAQHQSPRFVDVDPDFIATIAPAKKPLSFVVKVIKVNPRVDKQVIEASTNISYPGLTIKDTSGRIVVDPYDTSISWDVKSWSSTSIVWDVSFNGKLKPGTYIIEPIARVFEVGKDKVSTQTIHNGNVAADFYPAKAKVGNSIKVTVDHRLPNR